MRKCIWNYLKKLVHVSEFFICFYELCCFEFQDVSSFIGELKSLRNMDFPIVLWVLGYKKWSVSYLLYGSQTLITLFRKALWKNNYCFAQRCTQTCTLQRGLLRLYLLTVELISFHSFQVGRFLMGFRKPNFCSWYSVAGRQNLLRLCGVCRLVHVDQDC